MHNWRLLLLAFLAALQPISTYTERNFDGRQQCSERSSIQDTELLYGRHRSSKFVPEDRRLNHLETREVRLETSRYEVRDNSLTPTTDKREREVAWQSPERARFSRALYRDRESRERLTDLSRERVANVAKVRNNREENDPHISTRDSNRRADRIPDSRERSERASRDVRQDGRDTHKSTIRLSHIERRIKGSFNDERSRLSFDARREARRARDLIGQSQKNAETRETRITLIRERDEVARREFSRSSEASRNQERIGQESRLISFRQDSSLQPRERHSLDRISEGERRSSLNRGGAEQREVRREARDENRARENRNLTQRERTERSRKLETRAVRTESSVENQRIRDSRIDIREERRSSSRVSKRDSRSRKTDFRDTRMKSSVRLELQDDERMVRNLDREVRRVDVQRVKERESQLIRENSRDTEGREMSGDSRVKSYTVGREAETSRSRETRLTAEVDSRRIRESNRNLERRETRTSERHDVSRNAPRSSRLESNRLRRSITNTESKRVDSRKVNERESPRNQENIQDMAHQERRSYDHLNRFRESRIQPSRPAELINEQESPRNRENIQDMAHQERRSYDRLNRFRESRNQPSRSAELIADLKDTRVDSRRTSVQRNGRTNDQVDISREKRVDSNRLRGMAERFAYSETRRRINEHDSRRIREISREMERRESRTSRAKLTRSLDREVNIETRRIDSRRINERESKKIRESSNNMERLERSLNVRLSDDRGDSSLSRSTDRVADLEARRVDSRRVNERESRRIRENSRDMERLQRLNDALDRRPSRSADRVAELEARRVDSRRVNQRESGRIRESSRAMAHLQRSNYAPERRLSRSPDRVANLEARRAESRRNNERESRFRDKYLNLERPAADRLDTSRGSLNKFTRLIVDNMETRKNNDGESPRIREKRETSRFLTSSGENPRLRNIRLEARIIKSFALERDSIESRIRSKENFVKNRESWNLKEKDLEDSKPFTMNWQYIFYTLQGIYLASMLLQVVGSDKNKIRSHGVWDTAQKLIKVD